MSTTVLLTFVLEEKQSLGCSRKFKYILFLILFVAGKKCTQKKESRMFIVHQSEFTSNKKHYPTKSILTKTSKQKKKKKNWTHRISKQRCNLHLFSHSEFGSLGTRRRVNIFLASEPYFYVIFSFIVSLNHAKTIFRSYRNKHSRLPPKKNRRKKHTRTQKQKSKRIKKKSTDNVERKKKTTSYELYYNVLYTWCMAWPTLSHGLFTFLSRGHQRILTTTSHFYPRPRSRKFRGVPADMFCSAASTCSLFNCAHQHMKRFVTLTLRFLDVHAPNLVAPWNVQSEKLYNKLFNRLFKETMERFLYFA